MKTKKLSIISHISVLVFSLITIVCLLFMGIGYFSTSNFHEASMQLLNKDVAAHIARFTSPFTEKGIDKKKADSVFYDAMVLSPSAEVYFLDTVGKVIAYHADENNVNQWILPLDNIKKLIASQGKEYIKSTDPRDPANPKVFSAAEVYNGSQLLGFIYVILGSNKNVTRMLYNSYFNGLIIKVFFIIILLSILFSFFYINRFQKSFNYMLGILEKFQNGDFEARFPVNKNGELEPVTTAFNKMADLLVYNIDKITQSEKERKDFIANISHDLRTPLSVARGYTETLLIKNEKEISPQEEKEYLQLVYKKMLQVEYMVTQLFQLSKMESVAFVPKKEPFIFSEVVQEIIHESFSTAKEKNISIDNSNTEDVSWVFGDIAMMERLIQNLMVNAIKYTPQNGSIKISLTTQGSTLIFNIQNSGTNLSRQMMDWFNNSSDQNLLSNRPANTGLGLVIVKKILQLHQFKYELVSAGDSGNIFVIYIPIREAVKPVLK